MIISHIRLILRSGILPPPKLDYRYAICDVGTNVVELCMITAYLYEYYRGWLLHKHFANKHKRVSL